MPWIYNRVQFTLDRGSERIECAIEPSGRLIDFTYSVNGRIAVALELRRVAGLRAYQTGGSEGLLVLMQDESRGDLDVRVLPDIRFTWQENPD